MRRTCSGMAGAVIGLALPAAGGGGGRLRRRRRSTSSPRASTAALPIAAGADTQAKMYDGLTPLFDQVTNADLTTYFKSERFGVDTADPEHDRGRAARRA